MSTGRILVVAPNLDLRKSLAFALEAEGYVVTAHAEIPNVDAGRSYDCVVLDHKAASGNTRDTVLGFCTEARRVVLLAGTPQTWLLPIAFAVVQTPLSGEALAVAVQTAIRAPASSFANGSDEPFV